QRATQGRRIHTRTSVAMNNYNEIAKQFVDYYYHAFDNDRSSLAGLYVSESDANWRGVIGSARRGGSVGVAHCD
ncbi:hypothetical protein GGH92_010717, partial [Coemansia sp. RSA 2673]